METRTTDVSNSVNDGKGGEATETITATVTATLSAVPVAGLWSQPTGSSQVVDGQAHAFAPALGSTGRGIKSGTGYVQSGDRISINTNTGDSGFTFEGWIHPFSSSVPTHDSVGGGIRQVNVSVNLVRALEYAKEVGAGICGKSAETEDSLYK